MSPHTLLLEMTDEEKIRFRTQPCLFAGQRCELGYFPIVSIWMLCWSMRLRNNKILGQLREIAPCEDVGEDEDGDKIRDMWCSCERYSGKIVCAPSVEILHVRIGNKNRDSPTKEKERTNESNWFCTCGHATKMEDTFSFKNSKTTTQRITFLFVLVLYFCAILSLTFKLGYYNCVCCCIFSACHDSMEAILC